MSDIDWTIGPGDIEWEMDWTSSKARSPDNERIQALPDIELMFEEEHALALLLHNDQVFLNDHWWMKDKGWPKEACQTFSFNVNCNDVFYWGSADAEEMFYTDIKDVYDYYMKDTLWGTAVWCIKKRNMMPQKPVYERIKKQGIWDLDSMNLEPNPTWK